MSKSKLALVVVVVLAALICPNEGYSSGAPADVCADMTPKHPALPQTSPMPYDVLVSKKETAPGGKVQITVKGKSGKKFKGFIVQVRQGDKPIGKFEVAAKDGYTKTMNCNGRQNSVTHKNSDDKASLTTTWVAPNIKDTVQVYVTVAEDGGTYWVRQPTATLRVV